MNKNELGILGSSLFAIAFITSIIYYSTNGKTKLSTLIVFIVFCLLFFLWSLMYLINMTQLFSQGIGGMTNSNFYFIGTLLFLIFLVVICGFLIYLIVPKTNLIVNNQISNSYHEFIFWLPIGALLIMQFVTSFIIKEKQDDPMSLSSNPSNSKYSLANYTFAVILLVCVGLYAYLQAVHKILTVYVADGFRSMQKIPNDGFSSYPHSR